MDEFRGSEQHCNMLLVLVNWKQVLCEVHSMNLRLYESYDFEQMRNVLLSDARRISQLTLSEQAKALFDLLELWLRNLCQLPANCRLDEMPLCPLLQSAKTLADVRRQWRRLQG